MGSVLGLMPDPVEIAELARLSIQVNELVSRVDGLMSGMLELRQKVAALESGGSSSGSTNTRSKGYVNWDKSHDILKTKRWVKLSLIVEYIGKMESLWNFGTGKEELENLPTSKHLFAVTESQRFPKDGAYVNIYSPSVSSELSALSAQRLRPATGVVQRFKDNCLGDATTFSSFEEQYQLRWVD